MSGGVDSAVTAYLLKKQGYDITGIMMSIWNSSLAVPNDKKANACFGPEEEDIEAVKKISPENNSIIVEKKDDLYSDCLISKQTVWNSVPAPEKPYNVMPKIRQQHTPAQAIIYPLQDNRYKINFKSPQISITSGQSVVFYKKILF